MKLIKFVLFYFLSIICIGCDNTPDNEIIIDGFEPDKVIVDQMFNYTNSNGESLFGLGIYRIDQLSIIATDEHFNNLYINNILVADIPNHLEILSLENNVLTLRLGRHYYIDEDNNSAKGYYKLKYDEEKFDTIEVDFYYNIKKTIQIYITKITYNGVEYPYTGATINIQKED